MVSKDVLNTLVNIILTILSYLKNPQILLIFHSWNLWNSCFRRYYVTKYEQYGHPMVWNSFWDLKPLQPWICPRYLDLFIDVAHFPTKLTKYTKLHYFIRWVEFLGMSSYEPESSSVEKFKISGSFFIY